MMVLIFLLLTILTAIVYYFRERIPTWFKEGLESIAWNIVGNLLPLYVMSFVAISNNGFEFDSIYEALHQPFTVNRQQKVY